MKFFPVNNRVVIRPDNVDAVIQPTGRNNWYLPVSGTVVAISELNHDWTFLQEARKRYDKKYPSDVLFRMRYAVRTTIDTKPVVKVKTGDKVFFSYLVNNAEESIVDGLLICHHDSLIAKADTLEPLNGYLLVKMDENDRIVGENNAYGTGTVIHSSPPTEYRDGGHDDPRIVAGCKISFLKDTYVRLESDIFNTTNEGGNSSLFCIKRKDVMAFSAT